MEKVNFHDQNNINRFTKETFNKERARIKKMLPEADIQHVGSTAVPNSLTKGDLDIQVRVSQEQFAKATALLSQHYDINKGSVKTNGFRAFKDDTIFPPLGVQLTVFHSEFDFFWKFRDILLHHDKYKKEYDQLKRNFEGKSMAAYREAKDDFFNKLKSTSEYKDVIEKDGETKNS